MQVSRLWFWISVWVLGWVTTFWFGLLARGFSVFASACGLTWVGLFVSGGFWVCGFGWCGIGLVPWASAVRSGLTFGLRLLGVWFLMFCFW